MGLVLLRYGELALKGRNRSEFVRRLVRNVRACLRANAIQGEVTQAGQRVYVRTEQVEAALPALCRVFGLVSVSPVISMEPRIDAIISECVRQAKGADVGPDVAFRVRSRRSDKTFPYISPEIDRLAGEAIVAATRGRVDLSKAADVTIGVEISREQALVFGRVLPGPGGLPLGVSGRVVALISGGIDSPVAAWMMMKRGCTIIPVHFSQNQVETQKALDNVDILGRYSYGWTLHPTVLDHNETISPTLRELERMGEERWSCVFCKRALLSRAAQIAEQYGAHGIVMGDSLGQVASQTLLNLEVVSHGIAMPILRPLLGLDKVEIIDIARRIGTFDVSTRASESCPFLPAHPLTRGTVDKLEQILAYMKVDPE